MCLGKSGVGDLYIPLEESIKIDMYVYLWSEGLMGDFKSPVNYDSKAFSNIYVHGRTLFIGIGKL